MKPDDVYKIVRWIYENDGEYVSPSDQRAEFLRFLDGLVLIEENKKIMEMDLSEIVKEDGVEYEDFKGYEFSHKTKVRYDGEWCNVIAVDFEEEEITFKVPGGGWDKKYYYEFQGIRG